MKTNPAETHLHIAMLGHKRIPSREGGVEVAVGELSVRMAALGHQVTCLNRRGRCANGPGTDGSRLSEYRGVRLESVWTLDKKGAAAVTSSLSAAVKAALGKYDVVHFHAEGPCAMLWIPKLFGKRCIATIHGLDWQRAKWGAFASRYIKLGEKTAARYADEMIVLSKGAQTYFENTYGRKTVLIPNGVNRPTIRKPQLIRETFGLDQDSYILFLGRLVPEKGIARLIEAFQQTRTDKKLVIAGGSSDTDDFLRELKKCARQDERILFTGFVQGQLLEELYSNSYFYVLPSDLEGMPLGLLEAMSYGNCCLVSDIAECTDVVEDKAVTFQRGNVDQLKEKLQQLCDRPDLVEQYRNAAAGFILKKYNWDDVVEQTIALYRKAVEKAT